MFLREGIAQYLEVAGAGRFDHGECPPLRSDALVPSERFMGRRTQCSPWLLTKYIIDRWGMPAFRAFYSESTCDNYKQTCRDCLGESWTWLVKDFNRRRPGPWPRAMWTDPEDTR